MVRGVAVACGGVVVVGLAWAGSVRAVPTAGASSTPSCRGLGEGDTEVRVQFAPPRTTDGCWFFSGPGALGRDDQLGATARWSREGARVKLRFAGAEFAGDVEGARVRLRRVSRHESWQVTETIEGELSGGCPSLHARYHYDECEDGGACPGTCHIDATVGVSSR